MPKMSGAQALVRQLGSEGVTTIFGLPGVQIMAAFDALHEVRDDIRLIHTRHEQATTYMAHGYSRVTGRVGVALVVPGNTVARFPGTTGKKTQGQQAEARTSFQ